LHAHRRAQALDLLPREMVVFNLVADACGIIAFLVLAAQGALMLRVERQRWLVRDPARSLAMAKRACDARHLAYTELAGIAAGLEVTGPAYKVRSVRAQGERENWLSQVAVDKREVR
jgi:hypothetical protein